MENENAIIKLTEELVSSKDDQLSLVDDYARLKEKYYNVTNKLERIIAVILDNCKLDYKEEDLDLNNDIPVLQYVKFIDPDSYEERLEELKKEAQERDNAAANLAENLKKEARKNGKS